jgi:hypothetical protein
VGSVSPRAESGDNFGQIVPHISLPAGALAGAICRTRQERFGQTRAAHPASVDVLT